MRRHMLRMFRLSRHPGSLPRTSCAAHATEAVVDSYGVPGVLLSAAPQPLSAIGPAEGAGMVAKAAGRVYSVLVSPRRWLTERALAVGPAAIMHAAPADHAPALPSDARRVRYSPHCRRLCPGLAA